MKKIYLFLVVSCLSLVAFNSFGQLYAVDPAGDGGFETGATFAANNWTTVNPANTALWQIGTAATGYYAGTRGAFVGPNATTYSYSTTASRTCHMYRSVTIPAGATNIQLDFKLRQLGETGWDRLLVYTAPTTVTPVSNSPAASSTTLTGATLVFTGNASSYTAFTQVATISLPASLAGTTFRLIFTWQNDASGGTSPGAAVDNISVKYCPAISITASPSTTICAGSTLTLTSTTYAGAAYSWTGPNSFTSAVQNPAGFTASALSAGTYSVRATQGTCTVSGTSTITVNAVPTGITSSTGAFTLCPSSTITLTGAPSGGTWSRTGAAIGVPTSAGAITGASAGSATVTYTGSNTCTLTQSVTVATAPTTPTITRSQSWYCSDGYGGPVTLTPAGTGTDFTWSPASGLSSSTSSTATGTSVIATPSVTTVYSVTALLGSCTTSSSITLYNDPVATFIDVTANGAVPTGGDVICYPGTGYFWAAVSATPLTYAVGGFGTYSSSDLAVATVDAGGTVYGITTGTAVISYTDAFCNVAIGRTVSVSGAGFTISVSPSSANYCSTGSGITLTSSAVGATPTIFAWVDGTTGGAPSGLSSTTTSSVVATPSAAGNTTYVLAATDGASGCHANSNLVTINNNTPIISGGTVTICQGATTTWVASGGAGTWTALNPTIATVTAGGVVTGVSGGVATIQFSNTASGCTVTRNITINALPTLSATPASAAVCSGVGVTLTASGASTYTWAPNTSLSATVGSSVVSTAASAITYTITGTAVTGCTNTLTKSVGIGNAVFATASASAATVCPSGSVTITGSGSISSGTSYTVTSIPYALQTITTPSNAAVGDQVSTNYSIGFTFNYYGTNYSTVNICTNGNINFGALNTVGYGAAIPSTSLAQGSINIFSHDMNTGSGTITYGIAGTAPNRRFIVSYNNYGEWVGTGTNSGQIILYETTNVIEIHITNSTTSQSYSSTCGIQNIAQNAGVAAPGRNYNVFNITTPEAWRFYPTIASATYAWTPTSGVTSTGAASTSATVPSATTYSVTITDATTGCNATATVPVGIYPVVPVTNPTAVPTGLTFSSTTSSGTTLSLTAASPAPTNYLIVRSTVAFSGTPTDNTTYGVSTTLGNGTVVANATAAPFSLIGLNGNTQYYFTALPYNATSCAGPLYYVGTQPSQGVITCPATPSTPAVSAGGPGGMTLTWSSSTGGGATTITYSVAVATDAAFTAPISGSPFTATTNSLNVTGLTSGTTYYYRVTAIGAGTCNSSVSSSGSYLLPTADYSTVTMTGFNQDLVAEGSAAPTVSTSLAFEGAYDFLSKDYSYSTAVTYGLPINGAFTSASTAGVPYQLPAYNGNNFLRITGSAIASPVTSGTITLSTPQYASNLYVSATGSAASNTVNFTVNYTDGSSEAPVSVTIADWYGGTPKSLAAIGRISRATGTPPDGTATDPNLYEYYLPISAANYTKLIRSITVAATGTGGYTAVGAVSKRAGVMQASTSSLSAFASTTVGCSSTTLSFTITGSTLYPTNGTIVGTAPTGFQISADGTTWGSTANFIYSGNAMSAVPVYVRFTPVSVGAAAGNVTFSGGTVNTPPSIAVSGTGTLLSVSASSSATGVLCTGGSATLSGSGSGVASYTWSPAAGLSATTGADVVATPTVTTTYTVTGFNATGCTSASSTVTVTYNENTTAISAPGGASTICSPGSLALIETGTGGTWSTTAAATLATVSSGGVVYAGSGTGVASITYSNPTCGGDATYDVTVSPGGFTVLVTASPSANYCNSGSSISLTADDGGAGAAFTWSPATGLSATTGATVFASPSATTVYTVTGGLGICSNSSTITVTNVTPAVITGGSVTICRGQSTTWSSATTLGTWTSSDNTIASVNSSTGVVTGTATTVSGTATITYTVGGCYVTRNIFVNILPTITATPATAAVCGGTGVTLTASGASTYSWAPGTGLSAATGASVVSTAASAITYTITGTTAAGCTNTLSKAVGVGAGVSATATANTFTVCAGSPVTLTGAGYLSSGTSYTVTSIPFSYVALDGSATSSVTGDETNSAALSLPFTFNFFGTNYTQFSLQCNGFLTFGATIPGTNYSPNNLPSTGNPNPAIILFGRDLNTNTTLGATNPIQYETFGTAPNRKFVVYFKNVNTYGTDDLAFDGQIILYETTNVIDMMIARKSASSTANTGIQNAGGTLYASPFGATSVNATGLTNTGYRFSIPIPSPTYAWTPSAGITTSTAASTAAAVPATTTYSVTVTNSATGCSGVATTTVNTWPAVLPAISPATVTACIGTATTLSIDQVTAGTGTWSAGSYTSIATVNSSTGAVTGVSAGTAVITYTNLCGTTTTRNVTVNPSPTVITVTPSVTGLCLGGSVTLSNGTPGGSWTSSNPSVASIDASTGFVTTVSGGSITFTYATGCGAPATIGFNVNAAPVDITPLTTVDACVGQTVTLSEASLGGTWGSLDNSIATVNATTGIVTGVATGTATITYGNGCGADVTRDVTVNPAPGPVAGFGTICQGTAATLTNSLAGGTWVSSNTAIATVDAITGQVGGVSGGTATISYVTTGCNAATASEIITPLPAAIGGATVMCISSTTTLTNSVSGGSNPWSSTSATSSGSINTATGVVTSTGNVGPIIVTYTNTCGSVSTTLNVISTPSAIVPAATSICAANAAPVILAQDCSSLTGQVPTGGTWSIVNTGTNPASTNNWRSIATGAAFGSFSPGSLVGGGNNYFGANADGEGSGTVIKSVLTSPSFSTLGLTAATLTFNNDVFSSTAWDAALSVEYSTDGGVSWIVFPGTGATTAGVLGGGNFFGVSNTAYSSWSSATPNSYIAIPAAALNKADVRIRYYYHSSYGFYWAIDDIKIVGNAVATAATQTTVTDATPGGTWSPASGAVAATVNSGGTVFGVSAGTGNITYSTPCGNTSTAITVLGTPGVISGASSVCVGGTTAALTNTTSGGTWGTMTPSIATVSATGVVYGVAAGTAVITYSTGCGASASKSITVNAIPTTLTGATALCATGTGSSGVLVPNNAVSGATWSRVSGTAATINASGTVTSLLSSGSGSAIMGYTNACTASPVTVTVTVGSGAPAAVAGSSTLCAPLASATTVLSQGFNTGMVDSTGGLWSLFHTSGNYPALFARYTTTTTTTAPAATVGNGTAFIMYNPNGTSAQAIVTELRSPSFSTLGMTAGTINFNQYFVYSAGTYTLDYSTNGGTSWTTISSFSTNTGSASLASTTSTALPAGALSNASVILRWMSSAASYASNNLWALDNMRVYGFYQPSANFTSATPGGTWSVSPVAPTTVSVGSFPVNTVGTLYTSNDGTASVGYVTSCGTATPLSITISRAPDVITGTATSLCAGSSITLGINNGAVTGGTWGSLNTAVATVNASTGQVFGVAQGSTSITFSTPCGSPTPYAISVLQAPGTITGNTVICTSSTGTLYNSATTGTWSAGAGISIGSSTGVITSTATPVTGVTVTFSNICGSATTTVSAASTPGAIAGYTTLCVPSIAATTLVSQSCTSLTGSIGGAWTIVNTSGNTLSYFQVTAPTGYASFPASGDGTSYFEAVPNAYSGNTITQLRSPSFATTSMTIATVTYNEYYSAIPGDVVTVDYSLDGGSSWSNITSYGGTSNGSGTYTSGTPQRTLYLPVAALDQASVNLRWYYASSTGNVWAVDNINVIAAKTASALSNATPGGSWTPTTGAVATVTGATGIVQAVGAGTVSVGYTACANTVNSTITVKAIPGTITGGTTVCSGSSLTLSVSNISLTGSGSWSVSDATIATITSGGVITGIIPGVVTVSYSNGCGSAATLSFTVKSQPAAIVGASSMCPSASPSTLSTTTYTNTVGGGTWGSGNTLVATVGTFSGVITAVPGVTSDSALITYSNGCGTAAQQWVSIDGSMDPIVGASSICSSPTALVQTSFESGVPSIAGSPVDGWSYVQGTGAANGYFTGIAGASTTLPTSGVPAGGGTNVVMFGSNTIGAGNTAALVSPVLDLTGGNGGRVSFYFYRDGTVGTPATTYDSVAVYVNTTPTIGGTRIGSVCRSRTLSTAFTGTVAAAQWTKLNYTIPAAFNGATNYIIIKGYSAGGGNNMYLDSLLIRNNSAVATLTDATGGGAWSTSNGTVATITSVGVISSAASITTSQSVTITYANACGSTTQLVAVNPTPGTNTAGATTLCVGATTTMVNSNVVAGGMWSTSNSAVATVDATTGDVTAVGAGTARISYTAGCGQPGVTTITVNPLPTVASITPSSTGLCAGAQLTLTAGAVSGTGGLVSYNWSGPAGYSATGTATATTYTVPDATATGVYSLSVTYPGVGCTSSTVQTGTVDVNDYPAVYNVTGGNGCTSTGISVGLDNSQSSVVSYALIRTPSTTVATLSGTSTTLTFSPIATIGTYIVKATSAVGCVSTMNGADTINTTPSASVSSAMPNICQPTTSASVGLSSIVGAPDRYSVAWDATALSDGGFSNISSATLSGSSVTLIFNPAGGAGSFDGSLTLSNAACTSAPYPVHVIVHANPTVSVTAINTPCVGYAGSIDFAGTDSATVSYQLDGGSTQSFTFSGTTNNLSTGVITSAHNYLIIDAHNAVCTTAVGTTITVDPTPMAWVGGTSGHESEWGITTNWSCGFVPTIGDDVLITAVASGFDPYIPSSFSAYTRNLNITSGGVLVIDGGGAVNVKGDYNNANNVAGSGAVILNGATAQTITGTGKTNNLKLENTAGATINTGSRLVIGSTITIAAGTLTTNDSLELASTDTNSTARVASLPASGAAISGKVKVDQYVMGGYRRYRFWSHPYSDTLSLSQLQTYIDITGPGGATNGFRTTGSNAPSAFRLDPYTSNSSAGYDPGWKPFTKINSSAADSNRLHPGQGIRLFFRGAKGEGLSYGALSGGYTPSSVVVAMLGHVNQGNVSIPLSQGTDAVHQSFNMVGNPYPSPVDMGTILWNARNNGQITGAAFYIFDPAMGAGGNFVTVGLGTTSAVPYYVQANTCIQVSAAFDGAHIDFTESDKSASTSNYLFKAPVQYTTLAVYDDKNHVWDRLQFNFNDKATDNDDKMHDAVKPMGAADFNFYSTSSDNHKLAIDSRPFEAEKVIPLGIASGYQQNFIIRADNIAVPAGGKLVLHDKLLEKYVDLKAGTEYPFTISKDNATQGDRFELALKSNVPAPVKPLAVTMTPNPTTDDVKISFTSGKKANVTVRVMDISGVSIYNQDLGEQQNGTITVPLSTFAAGVYMVELTQGEQKVTQRLVKE